MRLRVPCLVVLFSFGAGAVFPCGGPDYARITAAIDPLPQTADRLFYPYDGFETKVRDEIRFLPGLVLADSARYAPVLEAATFVWHDDEAQTPALAPSLVGEPVLRAALARNDLDAAEAAARALVRVLADQPAPLATPYDAVLRDAIELLDFAPTLRERGSTTLAADLARLGRDVRALDSVTRAPWLRAFPEAPRAASVAARVLRDRVQREIPDGWITEVRDSVRPATWASLTEAHDTWLARYAAHPFAPWVRAARARLAWMQGRCDEAWTHLGLLWRTAPRRAAYDGRYLLLNGCRPTSAQLVTDALPSAVQLALVGNVTPAPAEWRTLWARATGRLPRRVAQNLQERLLAAAALDTLAAPSADLLPPYDATWSELARTSWALAQLRAGEPVRALQAVAADDDSLGVLPLVRARAHLAQRHWQAAITEPALEADTRDYLLRVLAPDSAVLALTTHPDSTIAGRAAQTAAARAALDGDWTRAADLLAPVDRDGSALARRAAQLNGSPVALARHLGASRRTLFAAGFMDRVFWYRSVSGRWAVLADTATYETRLPPDLPWTVAEETAAIVRWLHAASPDWHALQAWRTALERGAAKTTPGAVREADAVYRRLVDYSKTDWGNYWRETLPSSPAAKAIRAAGRRTR